MIGEGLSRYLFQRNPEFVVQLIEKCPRYFSRASEPLKEYFVPLIPFRYRSETPFQRRRSIELNHAIDQRNKALLKGVGDEVLIGETMQDSLGSRHAAEHMRGANKSLTAMTESHQETVTFNAVQNGIMRLVPPDIMQERSYLEVVRIDATLRRYDLRHARCNPGNRNTMPDPGSLIAVLIE